MSETLVVRCLVAIALVVPGIAGAADAFQYQAIVGSDSGNASETAVGKGDVDNTRVARLIRELDSDRFDVRDRAAQRIEQLLAKPEVVPLLAAEFQRVLMRPDVSFEVRWRLEHWRRQLPAPPVRPAGNASAKELDALVAQLNDDFYACAGAAQRLEWYWAIRSRSAR